MQTLLLWLTPLFPLVCGGLCPLMAKNRKVRDAFVFGALCVNMLLSIGVWLAGDVQLYLFSISDTLPIYLRSDSLGRLFLMLVGATWLISGVFAFDYMAGDNASTRYFTFYMLTLGALNGLCLSGTLVTMYLCFEMMTLMSIALVIHNLTKEAVAAGIKYLIYSVAGAMLGLFGIFFFSQYAATPIFTPGGVLLPEAVATHGETLLWVLLVTVVGFGTKAGLFPMHGWLPTAHPIAPAPASAVLSGMITKTGVLCILRVIYYVVGADFLRDTWVQTTLLTLALITVFMGSMMALKATVLKKRLAYSTVSQVSYILFGVFLLNPTALAGAFTHLYFHSFMKNALFLCAGAVILKTGLHDVNELEGIGKRMPLTMWCFTLAGIGLVGIPPLSGFVSKWWLATGAISSGVAVFSWLGPVVLLVSALLTAGYLLPVSIHAFFPGHGRPVAERCEVGPRMAIPLVLLAVLTVLMGLWPAPILNAAEALAALLL